MFTSDPLRILYIDPDRGFREAIARYLSWHGLIVEGQGDSSQTLSQLKDGRYGLLICDAGCAPETGFELARKIRQSENKAICKMPILLVASDLLTEPDYRILRRWKMGFMTKYQDSLNWMDKINALLGAPA